MQNIKEKIHISEFKYWYFTNFYGRNEMKCNAKI